MSEEIISQTKLFVGGLNWKMRGRDLREIFEKFGEVQFATVKLDPETRRSRGFGFVEFVNADDATKAQAEMDEQEVRSRPIKVDFAKEDPEKLKAAEERQAAAAAETEVAEAEE